MKTKPGNIIKHLYRTSQPMAIICIGIGRGIGEIYRSIDWINLKHALFIDIEPKKLSPEFEDRINSKHWHYECSLALDENVTYKYYLTTNSYENGIIHPDTLKKLWPNIQLQSSEKNKKAKRLDKILSHNKYRYIKRSECTWTIIDCLSSLKVIQGAGEYLDRWDVIFIRVTLTEFCDKLDKPNNLNNITNYLNDFSYSLTYIIEENSPHIGIAIFQKNYKQLYKKKQKKYKHLKKNIEKNTKEQKLLKETFESELLEAISSAKIDEKKMYEQKEEDTSKKIIELTEKLELSEENLKHNIRKKNHQIKARDTQISELKKEIRCRDTELEKMEILAKKNDDQISIIKDVLIKNYFNMVSDER